MKSAAIVDGFVAAGIPADLARETVAGYEEAKRRYYLGDHRPTAVEGGRFCEAVTRILESELLGSVTPIGTTLPGLNGNRLNAFFSSTAGKPDGLRKHIPKALYLVYGIRNSRDAAHLADDIDPNLQDSTLVVGILDWIMAELVRLFHAVSPEAASALITDLVTREVPVIEEIDGQPVCSTDLGVSDRILVFLYRSGRDAGLDVSVLQGQMRHKDRSNLLKAIKRLDDKQLVLFHPKTKKVHITSKGMADVEERRLLHPA